MAFKTIADEFKACVAAAYPDGTEPEQFHQIRAMFYAGVLTMMHLNRTIGEPGVTEDQALKVLESWDAELSAYHKQYATQHGL